MFLVLIDVLMGCRTPSALAFSWCILSTCLGPQITGPLRELWDAAVRSPRSTTQSYVRSGVPSSRRRRELGFSEDRYTDDIELWERNMEARGRIE